MNKLNTHLTTNDNIKIPIIYSGASNHPNVNDLIIFCHGISTNKHEYLNFFSIIEEILLEQSFSTLRFDFRGHGESELSPREFSITSQLIDLYNVIMWAQKNYCPKRVSFLGASFGAPPCLMIDQWISNICLGPRFLIAPVLDYKRVFLSPESDWGHSVFTSEALKNVFAEQFINLNDDFYITKELLMEMSLINLETHIANCRSNIHVIHGTEDGMVSIDISRDAAEKHKNICLTEINNMEHGFTHFGDDLGSMLETQKNIKTIVDIITKGLCNG